MKTLKAATVQAFRDAKCPKCGEADRLRLNPLTKMVDCPRCKKIFKLKED